MRKVIKMKVVEVKRIKLIALALLVFTLMVLIYIYQKSRVDHSHRLDKFIKIKKFNSRKFVIDDNKLLQKTERDSMKKWKSSEDLKDVDRNTILEYTIPQEQLESKYEDNMKPDNEQDIVEYIPPLGRKYRVIDRETPAPMYRNTPTFKAEVTFDYILEKDVEIENRLAQKNKNIFYEKDNFIKVTRLFKEAKPPNKAFRNIPVYEMPRIKTNVLLEEEHKKSFEQREKEKNNEEQEFLKDYEVEGEDDEEIGMEGGEEYALMHNLLASRVTHKPPKQSNLPSSVPKHHYVFTSRNFPERLEQRPSFGNGFVAGVVRGREVHVSGLYTGRGTHSHRASIPSTFCHNLSISDGKNILLFKKTYKLDVSTGIYSETWKHPHHHLVQRVYAHRTLRNLMVYEVDYKRGHRSYEGTKINVELNKWRDTSDLTFSVHESADKEVSYKVGRVNGHETQDSISPKIHVLYDHIATQLIPSKAFARTKWTFLSAYAHSKEEVKQAYEEGKELIVGRDDLIKDHMEGWGVLWKRGRVEVSGVVDGASSFDTASHLAKSIYSSLYYTFTSLPLRFDQSFRGMSESGLQFGNLEYPKGGRVKASQELFIYPPLLLLHNFFAKIILKSRKESSQGALTNAKNLQRRGMLYAFESGFSGVELSENNKRCDISPYVSAAVSHAIRQYYYATDDLAYVNKTFSYITSQIAEYLQNRLYTSPDAYHVNDQIALDESHGSISDSPFSNSLIKEALSFPHQVTSRADGTSIAQFLTAERWSNDAEKIYLPSMQTNLLPAFKGYNLADRVDEADVIMLSYPLNSKMTKEMRLANVDFYDQMTLPTSSMMTKAMFLVNWLSLGRTNKANVVFNSFLSLNNNDFRTWSPSTKDFKKIPNHLPTMGAFLQVILNGYLGSRLLKDRLDINPSLPLNISSMHVVGIDYIKHSINVNIKASTVNLMVTKKHPKSPKLIAHIYNDESRYELKLNKQISLPRTRIAIIRQSVAEQFKNKLT